MQRNIQAAVFYVTNHGFVSSQRAFIGAADAFTLYPDPPAFQQPIRPQQITPQQQPAVPITPQILCQDAPVFQPPYLCQALPVASSRQHPAAEASPLNTATSGIHQQHPGW